MKTPRHSSFKRGFTLMELMVAMTITTIIVTVLISITSIAMDTWNRSRAELRAARQGKAMVDTMARDFESLVTRGSNTNEWFSAVSKIPEPGANAAELIFFTAATDRYNGDLGTATDKGGDVSCINYRLKYRDPITGSESTDTKSFPTFTLNRLLVDPDKTFKDLLGKPDLAVAFAATSYAADIDKVENFVCENISQFTITFTVEAIHVTGTTSQVVNVPISIGPAPTARASTSLKIKGTGLEAQITSSAVTADELKAGKIVSVEIAITVLTDTGVDMIRKKQNMAKDPKFMAKNSYQYSKRVQISSR